MNTNRVILLLVGVAGLAFAPAVINERNSAEEPDAILGIWETEHTETNYSHVEVHKEAGKYYGKIIWLKNPLYPDDDPSGMGGRPRVDLNNSKKSLRTRPIMGLEVMRSFTFDDDDGKWIDGRIYDPDNGKEYRCQMALRDANTLDVYGYVKIAFIKVGRHTTWTRVKKQE
jgi:uncharacterized protein (DUF2147 family)